MSRVSTARSDRSAGSGGGGGGAAAALGGGGGVSSIVPPPPVDDDVEAAELEHVIGFTGRQLRAVHHHPKDPRVLIYPVGRTIVFADVTDPHKQQLLRGHDEEVEVVSVSPSGRFIASGQRESQRRQSASVLVWDTDSKQIIYQLTGLDGNVSNLQFSFDDRFLAGIGRGEQIVIWDMQTGSPAQIVKCKQLVCMAICWSIYQEKPEEQQQNKKRAQLAKYQLISCHSTQVKSHILMFDIRSMQYVINSENLRFPSAGLQRQYNTCIVSKERHDEVLCGTSAGELVVLNTVNLLFRATLPISTNGLLSLCACGPFLFSGAGDGTVKKLSGNDQYWSVSNEISLAGRITSLTAHPDEQSLTAATDGGGMFQISVGDMSVRVLSENPVESCCSVAFGPRSDLFVTLARDGNIRVWDLGDYSVISRANAQSGGSSLAVSHEGEEIICGLTNGAIQAFSLRKGDSLWNIPKAHRGAVTALTIVPALIFSGGEDGTVRAWSRKSRQFVAQFSEHSKAVTGLIADCRFDHLLHSCSLDKTIITYDLRQERRSNYHSIQEGGLCSLSQRTDSEQELVSAGMDGLLLFWDCDEQQPVAAFDAGRNLRLNSVSVSPSSRFVAVVGEDGAVRIWDLHSNSLVALGSGHSRRATCVSWSPDERQFVTVAEDCTIAVWNFYLGEMTGR